MQVKKRVTLRDLAEKLGLSTAAVSKALRGHEGVSEATRELVVETARQMRYKAPQEESDEGGPQSGKVYILKDARELGDPHTMSLYYFLDRELKSQGLDAKLHPATLAEIERPAAAMAALEQPLAFILLARFPLSFVEALAVSGKPILAIDNEHPGTALDSVSVNSYHGAFLAVQHLAALGHSKIGYIGDNQLMQFRARYSGFRYALEHWAIPCRDEYIYNIDFQSKTGDINYNQLLGKLNFADMPTAFFCANDPIAYVLNNMLTSRGVRVPDDISIVGFDNLDASQWQFPPLTSINFPREDVARAAVNLLLWRLNDQEAPNQQVLVHPSLVERQSAVASRQPMFMPAAP